MEFCNNFFAKSENNETTLQQVQSQKEKLINSFKTGRF